MLTHIPVAWAIHTSQGDTVGPLGIHGTRTHTISCLTLHLLYCVVVSNGLMILHECVVIVVV